jgi:hypothetical protein
MLRPTVSRPVCLGFKPHRGPRPDCYCSQTCAGLLMWGALSDERTGLSFTIVAGPCQRSHFRVRVPWDSRPYFTVSDSRLPFSSSPTTRRVTVEVFDPASTRDGGDSTELCSLYSPGTDRTENVSSIIACPVVGGETTCPQSCSLGTVVVLSPVYTAVTWQWVSMSQY